MRLINKRTPPPLLTTYQYAVNAAYNDMDANVKNAIKVSLLNEQGWVCGYCQLKIDNVDQMRIEHHCEQSICNGQNGTIDRRLDYTNMMAVCRGDGGNLQFHCDQSKARFNSTNGLPIGVSPWVQAHVYGISYHATGLINSLNPRHDNEINTILNLNIQLLKNQRKSIYNQIFAEAPPDNPRGIQKFQSILRALLEFGNNRFSNPFPGLYEYLLRIS